MATPPESRESNAGATLNCPPSLWPALSALAGQPWPPVSEAGIAAFVRGAVGDGSSIRSMIGAAMRAGASPRRALKALGTA